MTAERLYEVLTKYAESRGQQLNKDREYVLDILKGLLTNESRYGYRSCPCRLASGVKEKDRDIICPCVYKDPDIQDHGSCYCGLYVSKEWNGEKIKHVKVPERRQRI
ncbi:MAG: ferredoxin-thioredoxin reductase catalytic domain-containing protein [Nitrospirota bacterium]